MQQVLHILSQEKLYGNFKKCHFFSSQLKYLGYVVLAQGIQVDNEKIRALKEWLVPTSIQQVYGLASFYKRFVRSFSSLMAPITEVLKGKKFEWTDKAQKAFDSIKDNLTSAPILALPNFAQVFEVEFDASGWELKLF